MRDIKGSGQREGLAQDHLWIRLGPSLDLKVEGDVGLQRQVPRQRNGQIAAAHQTFLLEKLSLTLITDDYGDSRRHRLEAKASSLNMKLIGRARLEGARSDDRQIHLLGIGLEPGLLDFLLKILTQLDHIVPSEPSVLVSSIHLAAEVRSYLLGFVPDAETVRIRSRLFILRLAQGVVRLSDWSVLSPVHRCQDADA